jgi:type 2A phosphatase activator TIP41
MPSGFLVLQRFLLRVDDVVFRLFDTRMYCAFDVAAQASSLQPSLATPALPQPGARPGSTVAPPAMAPWASAGTSRPPPPSGAAPSLPSLGGLSLGQPRRNGGAAPHPGYAASSATIAPGAGTASSSSSIEQRLIRECSGCEAPYKDVKAVSLRQHLSLRLPRQRIG